MTTPDAFETKKFAAGERIFEQGDAADAAYLVDSGSVAIHQTIDGHLLELDTTYAGEIFGEMAVLDGGRRMATAVAAEACVVSRLSTAGFRERLASADRFLQALIVMVIKNIKASHRVFLRRPRSFRDHIRQMHAFSSNIRRFAARIPDQELAGDLVAKLVQLDRLLDDLHHLSIRCPDQRHDIILDVAEVNGVGLEEVVGSESRRRVYTPPRGDQ